MSLMIRSASLTGYVDLARAVGLDPYRMAAAQGLPPSCLSDPDLLAPANAVGRLLEASAHRSGAIDFGLRLAETRNLSNLGALGLIAREQPTLGAALETVIHYMWSHNQALSLRVEMADEVAVVRATLAGPRPNASRQSNETTVAVLVRTLRRLVGSAWRPEAVLGVTPEFGAAFNGVVIPLADLERPIAGADPVNARRLERWVEQAQGRRRDDPVATTRDLISALLPTGACSVERVARHLGVDRRTLHRRLSAAGFTFRSLLEEERARLASAHIAAGERSLTEIADLLGYASLSAFSRWRRARTI